MPPSAERPPASPSLEPPGAYLRLIGIGALIGVPAALLAAVFLAIVHEIEDWLWEDLPRRLDASSPPWYLVIGLPVAGACVVLAARALLPGDGGHKPLEGIAGPPTPLAHAPGVALAAIGTLCFGAVLGPEAPLIALGSVVGVAATRMTRLGPKENAVLGSAGSFAAISALFGGPLVAGMLLVEGGLAMGAALLPALIPGLVAAAIGYVLFVGLGDWGGLEATALAVPGLPLYDTTRVADLLFAIAVGILTAVLVAAIREGGARIERLGERRVPWPALLLAGGLAVGLLAQLGDALGATSQEVLFSGQASIPEEVTENSAGVLLVLLATKGLAYAISLGCGFRGGPIFPAIFLGVGIATFGVIAFDMSITVAVAIGAGAGMASGTRLVFSSLLFASLLVGRPGLDAIPAAVLAVVAAWLTMQAVDRLRAGVAEQAEPVTRERGSDGGRSATRR